ncbi:cysteine-rich CWC family protein [Colwellia piezophila]|uniref:cysteine-rich CWC family protein n=1 Tax=Colwellia piezophila TaxID=211668 RepID=UPI00036999E4|nr:cysteine-rich CWC family protein [Colwellia piezophila]
MVKPDNDSICPLCEQSNRCDVNAKQGCWCLNIQVPPALLAQIPAELKGISCVCNACITRFNQQQSLAHRAK